MSLPKHLNIVALETFFTPLPTLTIPPPHTFSLTTYHRTTPTELPSRIKDAHILITTTLPLRAEILAPEKTPNLRLIAVLASGVDSVDLKACEKRGIRVLNSPGANVGAVAEHAVALYFAARRSLVPTMAALRAGEWPRQGTLMARTFNAAGAAPRGCRDEVAVVVGYGGVGRRVEELFSGLGMRVVVAGRKGDATPPASGRVPFADALAMATVLVLCCPRTPETLNMISGPEFGAMRDDAVVVNVARGGIVDEEALLKALREGKIAGAAVDVFGQEPAGPETSVLLGEDAGGLNLVVTPHTAWIGMDTTANYQRILQENIDGFIKGELVQERVKA
ncbi:glycerate dehydrogenase [Annulohypoxylon moriforme]|nr:glycerate dehydrogenase [Annulohypoxylon moriforme]